MAIKLVVFDMAGTTVRDKNYVGKSFTEAMRKQGYNVSVEDVNPIMGYKKPVAIRMMLEKYEQDGAKITDTLIDTIHEDFVALMLDFYHTSPDIQPLPGVEETFEQLRSSGIHIGLDTGFSKDIAQVIIDRLDWSDKIDVMVASDEVEAGRPYPYMIYRMMDKFGIHSAEEVAKVGDTEVDINEGLQAGCKYVVGITTGSFSRSELEPYGPTHIIDHISDILPIIR